MRVKIYIYLQDYCVIDLSAPSHLLELGYDSLDNLTYS